MSVMGSSINVSGFFSSITSLLSKPLYMVCVSLVFVLKCRAIKLTITQRIPSWFELSALYFQSQWKHLLRVFSCGILLPVNNLDNIQQHLIFTGSFSCLKEQNVFYDSRLENVVEVTFCR